MTSEIRYYGRDGQENLTLTATLYDDAGAVDTSGIVMTETAVGTSNVYEGDMPALTAMGQYTVVILNVASRLGIAEMAWDGTQEVTVAYIRKLLANRRTTNDTTNNLIILDDDNVTELVSGDLWEDTGRTSEYDSLSTGIRVQDQLT